MAGVDSVDNVVLNLLRQLRLRRLHILYENLNTLRLNEFELVVERSLPVSHHLLEGSDVLLRQGQHGFSLEGDGVTHVAAMPAGQTGLVLADGLAHHLHQQLVGVGATLVDLQSAVATTQVLHRHLHGSIVGVGIHLLVFQGSGDVDATS